MAKPTVKDHHGCGDSKCWCAEAKKLVIAAGVENTASCKQDEPFHRGWWLKNHPEVQNGKKD